MRPSPGRPLFYVDGGATPYYAAYGATKAALPQLAKTLQQELTAQHHRHQQSGAYLPPAAAAAAAAATDAAPGLSESGVLPVFSPAAEVGEQQLPGSFSVGDPQAAAGGRRPVGVHVLSPGMMLTDLLLENASQANKQVGLRCRESTSGQRAGSIWLVRMHVLSPGNMLTDLLLQSC